MDNSFLYTPADALDHFNVSESKGLSKDAVQKSRQEHGPNALAEEPPTPMWELILEQFKDQLVLILLGSAAVSFVLALFEESDDWTAFVDPAVILTILILNAVVGVTQESSAEKAIAALQEYSANEAKVVRDGKTQRVKAEDLVPGDVIQIAVGDRIPADCRLLSIHSNSFRVDQAILTGESESVSKDTKAIKDRQAVKQDQINMLFSGTTVVNGHATALVVLTGGSTAIGDIHESITSQISEPTPLKQKLNDFGDMLAKVITVICVLVWLINIEHFNDPSFGGWTKGAIYYLKIAVSLGVAAIPEGLAVVITTCLALGTRKMAQKNAVVRSLPSVETLGSCSVICSDKTGTLTTNQMSVEKIVYLNSSGKGLEEIDVEGTTFAPTGQLSRNGKAIDNIAVSSSTVAQLAEVTAICNTATLSHDVKTGAFSNIGEPTEAALRALTEKIGTTDATVNQKLFSLPASDRLHAASAHYESRLPLQATYEFSRDRKSMSVLVGKGKEQKLLVKGAPETIIERCSHILQGADGSRVPLSKNHSKLLAEEVVEYGNRGLRVMAIASVSDVSGNPLLKNAQSSEDYAKLEQEMTLIGLVGMLDPPRPEVAGAIRKCHEAGIRVIVITGDNPNTAESICRQIGVFGPNEDLTGKSYTGREFDSLSEAEKLKAVQTASLFSRTEPSHKSKLVDLLQSLNHVVAMTGDGVNDAPALKKSDIGVAMGTGTDVAKLAADMVLADDNFATITVAVEEGRSIYSNTQQFIRYLISSNIGEVVSIFITAALGMPEALVPVQLLWVNLVTDGLPATALSFNPPDHDVMRRAPRRRDEPLVGGWLFFRYMVIGIYVGGATVFGYVWWFLYNPEGPQITFWQLSHFHRCSAQFPEIGCEMFTNDMSKSASTVSLSILVVIEMLNAMNALSSSESLLTFFLHNNPMLIYAITLSMALHFAILYIPFLQSLFAILPLDWTEWQAVLAISAPVILIDEILKFFERQLYTNHVAAIPVTQNGAASKPKRA
jgi:Ca2+ transporting ATPase